jgi:UDP-galactopyranose mutase
MFGLRVVLNSAVKLGSVPKILLIGSGLYSLTLAERITSELQISVQIIEKRSHIGGNAYSEFDEDTGIEVHKYGSHLFHTSNKAVWDYLNQFTSFTSYQHTVWAKHDSYLHSLPINLATINSFFKKSFTPSEARNLIAEQSREITGPPQNLEEKAISSIGRPLYEAFIRGYTEKQWQTDPRELEESIINRLPVRFNLSNRYFKDTYEGLPSIGYTAMMEKMVENPLIEISLNTDFFEIKDSIPEDTLCIYTGPIDRYFNYKHGRLAWRTLDFIWETLPVDDFQGTSVVNYVDSDVPYTRIHEFQHLHPERKNVSGKTIIAREYSRFCETDQDEPYYPVNSSEDRAKLELYRKEIAKLPNTIFGGRLGSYQYLDMHMAIASALSAFQNLVVPWIEKSKL